MTTKEENTKIIYEKLLEISESLNETVDSFPEVFDKCRNVDSPFDPELLDILDQAVLELEALVDDFNIKKDAFKHLVTVEMPNAGVTPDDVNELL